MFQGVKSPLRGIKSPFGRNGTSAPPSSTANDRITEGGETRVTEGGETRVLESAL